MSDQQTEVATATDEPSEQTGNGPQEQGAATFAAYKKKGIMPFDETAQAKKTKTRGSAKRMITEISQLEESGGREQTPAEDGLGQDPGKTAKKSQKKSMAKKTTQNAEDKKDNEWLDGEGQLTVDVYQTENDLVVQSAIAGIKVEELDVLIEDDLVTIKGNRPNPLQESGDYFIEECYWGPFSRKIILPVEVDSTRADAAMKDGILTIRIPKIQREKKKKVAIKG